MTGTVGIWDCCGNARQARGLAPWVAAFPAFFLLMFALVDVSSLGRFSASPFSLECRATCGSNGM